MPTPRTSHRRSFLASSLHPIRQRARVAPRQFHCEMLEDRHLLSIVVNTLADETDGPSLGGISLRDAIAAAAPGDTIEFEPALTAPGPATILLTHGELVVPRGLQIIGPGATLLSIDASGNDPTPEVDEGNGSRVVTINDNSFSVHALVSISGLTLTGADSSGSGGAIYSFETLTLSDCAISGNVATSSGGGIYSRGQLTVQSSSISENRARYGSGGGITSSYGDVSILETLIQNNAATSGGGISLTSSGAATISSSSVDGNSADGDGGGIAVWNGNLAIIDSSISSNSSGHDGGGISFSGFGRSLEISRSTVSFNWSSTGHGGGVSVWYGVPTIADSSFNYNQADSGGGIRFFRGSYNGTLSIDHSIVRGNVARAGSGGGVQSFGSLTVTDSEVSSNSARATGGGIASVGPNLQLSRSMVSYNAALSGGGIFRSNSGSFSVTASTISHNTTQLNGGGIFSRDAQVSVTNSTISGNGATGSGGGLYLFSPTPFSLRHNTVTANRAGTFGGGVFFSGAPLDLRHSIVAANSASTGQDLTGIIGSAMHASYSLIGDNSGTGLVEAPVGAPDLRGNIIGGPEHGIVDPRLGPLTPNGLSNLPNDQRLQSHPLWSDSPAIDAGDPAALAAVGTVPMFDQRGAPFSRVADGNGNADTRIDMGAIEHQSLHIVVDTLADEDDRDYSTGDLSLREAISLANANVGSTDSIEFDPGLAGGTIVLTLGGLFIDDSVSVIGLGADQLTVDASGSDPTPQANQSDGSVVVQIAYGVSVHLAGLTLTGADSYYGGITNFGNLEIADSHIHGNAATGNGGGIFNSGSVSLSRCTISGNSAYYYGGGIYSGSGNLMLMDSSIVDNLATYGGGGGVFLRYGGNATISHSTIANNSAMHGHGGGIGMGFGALTVSDSSINSNVAGGTGGGVFTNGNVSLTGSTVSGNRATGNGGGIYGQAGSLTISSSTLAMNSTDASGGGIYHRYGDVTVTNGTIRDNSANVDGGGIAAMSVNLNVAATTMANNVVSGSGGALLVRGGQLNLTAATLNDNSATTGGGMASRDAAVTVTNSTVTGNHATSSGGGAYLFAANTATQSIRHSTFTANSADGFGGGIAVVGGDLDLDHTILARDLAPFSPDLASLFGTLGVRFSLIGDGSGSGLSASPTGAADGNGNWIGPWLSSEPLLVTVDMAAMGDFEAGDDSFLFEYSVDGTTFQPLFTIDVDESASQGYYMNCGSYVQQGDPLVVNGVLLNRYFQSFSAVIPNPGAQIQIRFTARNDGPTEAFAWRNLVVSGQTSGNVAGQAVGYDTSYDHFVSVVSDPDYTNSGDMFGVRSRLEPGVPSLPFDIVDDSCSTFPGDRQGIISSYDYSRFFGVVDTVNGIGNDTNTATWTFDNYREAIDPQLGPLADNGGPTRTHGLLADSVAVDAGDPALSVGIAPPFDQRGNPFIRVYDGDGAAGGRIDLGAVERQSLPAGSLVVDSLVDESDGNYESGDLSLREAIALARGSIGSDAIAFASSLTSSGPAAIILHDGELSIDEAMVITGPGAELLTIDASGSDPTPEFSNGDGSGVFAITAVGQEVAISGLTLTGADTNGGGGAIRNGGADLTISACTVSGNVTFGGGGGVFSNGTLTVRDSHFVDNQSSSYGGAIYASGTVSITASSIRGNRARRGGGLFVSANALVTASDISGNVANAFGGGIYSRWGDLAVTGSTVSGNSSASGGSGIAAYGAAVVSSSSITGNVTSYGYGGGIATLNHNLTVSSSTVSGNSAPGNGGGIWFRGPGDQLSITNSTISGNTTLSHGGGIYGAYGRTSIRFSTITLNDAPEGQGSGIASHSSTYTVTDAFSSIIAGNLHSDVDNVYGSLNRFQSIGYNLVGTGNAAASFNKTGDQTGIVDPMLRPLAYNGGTTKTHALMVGSPAIDAGHPNSAAGSGGVPVHDQRGEPMTRVFDGDASGSARIDIGAFELQPVTILCDLDANGSCAVADLDQLINEIAAARQNAAFDLTKDGRVNLDDRDAWLTLAGSMNLPSGNPFQLGDANLDGGVDGTDFGVWNANKLTELAAWSAGDFNADGLVDGSDFGIWNANKFTSADAPPQSPKRPLLPVDRLGNSGMPTPPHRGLQMERQALVLARSGKTPPLAALDPPRRQPLGRVKSPW